MNSVVEDPVKRQEQRDQHAAAYYQCINDSRG